jgi:DNA polymerase I
MFELDWTIKKHGAELMINQPAQFDPKMTVFLDCETDERDGYVGAGLCQDEKVVYYYTDLNTLRLQISPELNYAGHNLKYDAKMLNRWGIKIEPKNLQHDTIIMSYVLNSTKESHGLKDLGKEIGFEWPSYKTIVGSGKHKLTLDKQDVNLVANYCAMDVLVTLKLFNHFNKIINPIQRSIYQNLEMPTMRCIYGMELEGIRVDRSSLEKLDVEFEQGIASAAERMKVEAGKEFNPNSNKQTASILQERGIKLPKTKLGNLKVDTHTLQEHSSDPLVKTILEYNKIEKLRSTFTQGLLKKIDANDRVRTTFNQISRDVKNNTFKGIITGRLSSSEPNLQQIPSRSENGKKIKSLFIPNEGYIFADFDYSQIEPRIVAHISKDEWMQGVFKSGKDLYEALVEGTGRSRDDGKTFMLALLYGAHHKKLARVFKCEESEAENLIKKIMSKMPSVSAWINRTKWEAQQKKGIYTLMRRWIPLPLINSGTSNEIDHWKRVAVNAVIQGSAAEIMKKAMIECCAKGYSPTLTIHDELLFNIKECDTIAIPTIKGIMESVIKLEVPLIVKCGTGSSWGGSKK